MGKNGATISIPSISSVQELVAGENGLLLFRDQSYTEPAAWFQIEAGDLSPKPTGFT